MFFGLLNAGELFEVSGRFDSQVSNLQKMVVTYGHSETNPYFR